MKKLCILQNGLARGGTDTFVVNLCQGLDKKKFDVTVINPSQKSLSRVREPEVLESGAKIVHTTQLSGIKGITKHLFQLYRILKNGKFDIFQTNIDLFNGPNLFVAWLAHVPVRCCHSHNTRQNRELTNGTSLPIKLYQAVMRWMCMKFSTHRCGCSKDAMAFLYPEYDWLHQTYPTIINNGINIKLFKDRIDIESKKKELNLTAPKHLLTIGHLINQKNPHFIAKLFIEIARERSDIDLIWVGDGPLKDEIISVLKSTNTLDRVKFLSNRKDIAEIMHCADLFLLPSEFEGLGIVAIEAQAAGLPCLLSENVPAETDCGAAIYLSVNDSTDKWKKYINEILNGDIRLTVNNNKLARFSIENMVNQMTKVFES